MQYMTPLQPAAAMPSDSPPQLGGFESAPHAQAVPQSMPQAMPSGLSQGDVQGPVMPAGMSPFQGISAEPQDALPIPKPMANVSGQQKFLAFMAILMNRNFGPAFELKNLERKTDAYNQFGTKTMPEANRLIREKKYGEAIEIVQGGFTQLGAIAPEAAQFLQPMLTKIYDSQKADDYTKSLKAVAKADMASGRFAGDKQQMASAQAYLTLLDAASTLNTIGDVDKFMSQHAKSYHLDTTGRGLYMTDPRGFTSRMQLEESMTKGDLDKIGPILQSQTGINIPTQVNILSGKPYYNEKGENITPVLQQALNSRMAQLQGVMTNIDLKKLVPSDPASNEAARLKLESQGIKGEALNTTMATGGAASNLTGAPLTAEQQQAVDTLHRGTREEKLIEAQRGEENKLRAQGNVPVPLAPNLQDTIIVRNKKDAEDHRLEVREASLNEANKPQSGLTAMSRAVYEKRTRPSMDILSDLKTVAEMLESGGNPEGMFERLISGLRQTVTQYVGTSDPQASRLQAARLVAERAVEMVNNTASTKDQEVGDTKTLTVGKFADTKSSLSAMKVLTDKLDNLIDRDMGISARSANRPLGTTTSDAIKRAAGVPPKPVASKALIDVRSAVESAINERLKMPGQKTENGEFVMPGDSLEKAQEKLTKANRRLMEAKGKELTPGGGIIHWPK